MRYAFWFFLCYICFSSWFIHCILLLLRAILLFLLNILLFNFSLSLSWIGFRSALYTVFKKIRFVLIHFIVNFFAFFFLFFPFIAYIFVCSASLLADNVRKYSTGAYYYRSYLLLPESIFRYFVIINNNRTINYRR